MVNEAATQKNSERIKNLYHQLNYFNGKKADTLSGTEKLQLMALYRSSQNIKGFPPLPTELKKLITETIRTQKTGSSDDVAMAAAAHEQQQRIAEAQAKEALRQEQLKAFSLAIQKNPLLMYQDPNTTIEAIRNGHLTTDTKVLLDNGQNGTLIDFLEQETDKNERAIDILEKRTELYKEQHKQVLFTLASMSPEEKAKKLEQLKQIDPNCAARLELELEDKALMRQIMTVQYKSMNDAELHKHAKNGKQLMRDIDKFLERAETTSACTGELKNKKNSENSNKNESNTPASAQETKDEKQKKLEEIGNQSNAQIMRANTTKNWLTKLVMASTQYSNTVQVHKAIDQVTPTITLSQDYSTIQEPKGVTDSFLKNAVKNFTNVGKTAHQGETQTDEPQQKAYFNTDIMGPSLREETQAHSALIEDTIKTSTTTDFTIPTAVEKEITYNNLIRNLVPKMPSKAKNKKAPEQGEKALEQTATPQAEEAPIILPNTEEKVSEFSKKEDLILHTLAQLSPEERAKKLEQLKQIDSNSAAQLELELKNPERMKKIAAQGNLKSLSDEELKQHIKDETTVKKTTKDEASSSLQTTLKNAQTTAEPTPESTEQRDDANNTQKTGLASYAQPHQPNSVVDSSYKGR